MCHKTHVNSQRTILCSKNVAKRHKERFSLRTSKTCHQIQPCTISMHDDTGIKVNMICANYISVHQVKNIEFFLLGTRKFLTNWQEYEHEQRSLLYMIHELKPLVVQSQLRPWMGGTSPSWV